MNGIVLPVTRTAQSTTDLHPKGFHSGLPRDTEADEDLTVSKAFGLYHETPLLYSPAISAASDCNVFLKLENTQPSGSFKSRGIGHLCHLSSLDHRERTHLVCSSSGNAALAVAAAARMLQLKATACVHSLTSPALRDRLQARGCHVAVAEGESWEYADLLARQLVAEDENAVYIPPFDHPEVLRGASEIVREIKDKWDVVFPRYGERRPKPDAIVCSVGGGGLLGGILEGLRKANWQDVPVLGVESEKTASLLESLRKSWKTDPPAPRQGLLDKIGAGTICHSLGSRWTTPLTIERCIAHVPGGVSQLTVQEARIPPTIRRILADQHFLTEPACAITLAPFYPPSGALNKREVLETAIPSLLGMERRPNIVVVFCGGSFASLETLEAWTDLFAGQALEPFRAFVGGKEYTVDWET